MSKFLIVLALLIPFAVRATVPAADARTSATGDANETVTIVTVAEIESVPAPMSTLSAVHNAALPDGFEISPDDYDISEEDYTYLALAIYFEARSEPIAGQKAVAEVVLNRVQDKRFPGSVCGVVLQNEKCRHRCQFSFACDGRSDRPQERRSWEQAREVPAVVAAGVARRMTGAATHYHATYVRPSWAKRLERTVQVGRHVFYR